MPSNLLLLLPLLGGYLFNHILHRIRFRAQSLGGHRLVFEAALSGLFFLIPARALAFLLAKASWMGWLLERWPALTGSTSFVGTTVMAVLLAPISAVVLNLLEGFRYYQNDGEIVTPLACWQASRDYSLDRAIRNSGNALQEILHEVAVRGFDEGATIGLTMSNGKVYTAWVARSPNLAPNDQYVALLPLMSGYRDPDTREIKYNYLYPIIERPELLEDLPEFNLTVPISQIESAHLLEAEFYLTALHDLLAEEQGEDVEAGEPAQ